MLTYERSICSVSARSLRSLDLLNSVAVSYLHISRGAGWILRVVFLGERLRGSEFGWVFEAPAPCKDCLNLASVDSLERVNCSGDPAERSPGTEECLAYVPLGVANSIDRSRRLNDASRKVTVDPRRSIDRKSAVVKECGAGFVASYSQMKIGIQLTESGTIVSASLVTKNIRQNNVGNIDRSCA